MTANDICRALPVLGRAWFDIDGCGAVYLRRASIRVIDGIPRTALDIANIEIHESSRRRGLFSQTVATVELAAVRMGVDCVFVENIFNPIVEQALWRRGYTLYNHYGDRCAYKAFFNR